MVKSPSGKLKKLPKHSLWSWHKKEAIMAPSKWMFTPQVFCWTRRTGAPYRHHAGDLKVINSCSRTKPFRRSRPKTHHFVTHAHIKLCMFCNRYIQKPVALWAFGVFVLKLHRCSKNGRKWWKITSLREEHAGSVQITSMHNCVWAVKWSLQENQQSQLPSLGFFKQEWHSSHSAETSDDFYKVLILTVVLPI